MDLLIIGEASDRKQSLVHFRSYHIQAFAINRNFCKFLKKKVNGVFGSVPTALALPTVPLVCRFPVTAMDPWKWYRDPAPRVFCSKGQGLLWKRYSNMWRHSIKLWFEDRVKDCLLYYIVLPHPPSSVYGSCAHFMTKGLYCSALNCEWGFDIQFQT